MERRGVVGLWGKFKGGLPIRFGPDPTLRSSLSVGHATESP